jgi:peptide/nickel transport system substrate-binding protein
MNINLGERQMTMLSRAALRQLMAVIMGVILIGGLLSACGGGGSAGTGATATSSSTIAIGTLTGPSSLDPQTGDSGADYQWLWFVFARLINFNSTTGALEPGLATSWDWVGSKKLELDVHLRPSITFQDGTPMNAQAVVFNLERYMKEGDVINNLTYMTSADAIGSDEVAIHLSQPNAQIPYGLADRAGMMISPTAVTKDEKAGKSFATAPVGAGPYKFVSEVPNSSYDFTTYPGYYLNAQSPRVANVHVDVFQTATALATAERTGDVQVATNVGTTVLSSLKSDKSLTVTTGPSLTADIIQLDGKLKPFNNPKVRLAFSLALNRTAIMDTATNGLGRTWEELAPIGTVGYVPSQLPLWTYDPTEAKSLLAQAGYAKGVSLSCYNYPGLGWDITDPIVISEEAAVGIHLNIITGTPAQVGPFYKGTEGPCYVSGFVATANPVQITEGLLWSKSYYDPQAANFGVDQYVDKFFTSYTAAGEKAVFSDIWNVEKTNPGTIPVYSAPAINVYDKDITGWVISPIEQDNWVGLHYVKS